MYRVNSYLRKLHAIYHSHKFYNREIRLNEFTRTTHTQSMTNIVLEVWEGIFFADYQANFRKRYSHEKKEQWEFFLTHSSQLESLP